MLRRRYPLQGIRCFGCPKEALLLLLSCSVPAFPLLPGHGGNRQNPGLEWEEMLHTFFGRKTLTYRLQPRQFEQVHLAITFQHLDVIKQPRSTKCIILAACDNVQALRLLLPSHPGLNHSSNLQNGADHQRGHCASISNTVIYLNGCARRLMENTDCGWYDASAVPMLRRTSCCHPSILLEPGWNWQNPSLKLEELLAWMGVALDFPQHLPYFDICHDTPCTAAFLKFGQQSLQIIKGALCLNKQHSNLLEWLSTSLDGKHRLWAIRCFGRPHVEAYLLKQPLSSQYFPGAWLKLTKSQLEIGGIASLDGSSAGLPPNTYLTSTSATTLHAQLPS